jgi:cytoskeleton protein RodZ
LDPTNEVHSMSEPVFAPTDLIEPIQESAVQLTSGAMLRQAREALGLHIAALAVSLKVPVKKIEALEADRFDLLPDTVFVRALASSVCRVLQIDPDPVLKRLPHTTALPLKAYESGINVPFRPSRNDSWVPFWGQLSTPLVWVVAALLAGALALVFLPFGKRGEVDAASRPVAADATAPPPRPAPVPAPGNEPVLPEASLPAASAGGSALPVVDSGATTGAVVFRAQASSWVEVVDAGGVVQVRRNIVAGEVVGASGVLPLTVVVGRADSTQVEVHGKPFDLMSVAKNNVARFEVK